MWFWGLFNLSVLSSVFSLKIKYKIFIFVGVGLLMFVLLMFFFYGKIIIVVEYLNFLDRRYSFSVFVVLNVYVKIINYYYCIFL